MNTLFFKSAMDRKAGSPKNKLQRLAYAKGYYSSTAFAKAVSEATSVSYGTAFKKWADGKAGRTQYDHLLAIATFLGASSVEEVFDP